jgi:hypothetical protein
MINIINTIILGSGPQGESENILFDYFELCINRINSLMI